MSTEDFLPQDSGHLNPHLHPLLYLQFQHYLQPVQRGSEVIIQLITRAHFAKQGRWIGKVAWFRVHLQDM